MAIRSMFLVTVLSLVNWKWMNPAIIITGQVTLDMAVIPQNI